MSVFWFVFMQLCGEFSSFSLFKGKSFQIKLWLGSVLGSLFAIWTPIPYAFFFDFSLKSHIFGAVSAALITVAVILIKKDRIEYAESKQNDTGLAVMLVLFMIPVVVILLNHTISEGKYGLYTGQCTYGDMAMHLGFVTSIAQQQTFPPYYSILPTAKLCYPFLCDSISASFYLMGMPLRWAYMIPMFFAFLQVFSGVWYLASDICRNRKAIYLAYIMFFLCGGLGTIYFINGGQYNLSDIFTGFYKTPTNLTEMNIRWVNVIADMLIPQRATLFGWSILFAALWMLYRAVFKDEMDMWMPAGIIGGLLPMIHTHSYFALGLTAFAWLVSSLIREGLSIKWFAKWCRFGIPAVILAVPQLMEWTLQSVGGNSSFLRFNLDWVNAGSENFFVFWVKNVGPLFVIAPLAFVFTDRKYREICSGAMFIFIIGELFLFQPNPYDNNKIFYISYLFFCFLSADAVVKVLDMIHIRAVRAVAAALLVFVCTNAAVLTLGREIISGTENYRYELIGNDEIRACEYIKNNTPADAIFLTSDNHNNAVAVLTGRNIVCGSTSYVYYHGLDYSEHLNNEKAMLASPERFEELRETENVDYVYIGPHEAGSRELREYLEENYKTVYTAGNVEIFKIK